jgi:prepilin-type N-terminal cleavage/methylation domain-containing protein
MKGTKSSVVNGAWKKAGKCLAQSGFTLIELMVTISIMAVLLMIAVPSFQNATLGSKLSSFANGLGRERPPGAQRGDQAECGCNVVCFK